MISGEDESSSVLNGRLRPRKSTANIPNPPNKSTHKTENKAQDKLKRHSTPSKASPNKQDDLTSKAESSPPAQHLCPYCDKKFSTKISASKHARRIHLSKPDSFINCLFCNHSEAAPPEIIRHMVDSHPNQYFACLDCHTRFYSTSELAEHKLTVCEKQKQAYRSKLRQKTPSVSKKDQKKIRAEATQYSRETKELKHEPEFNSLVISCELKPSHTNDPIDIEDNITTNLILPSNIGNTVLDKNAVIILDDIQWNRRIPANFSFRNADADQILSRLGVVHRSPRVGETTRREWLKMIDVTSQKFEKCFDTNFYSRVASNVQQNLARFLDGSFNFSPDPDKVIKTRKTKSSAIINTAEGFPILLPHEQYSRNRFDGYMPRALAPKHKWKWDSTENDKNIIFDATVVKRDNHVDNCIITLVSSLDIWTQLRMRSRFEGIFCKAAIEKFEKQNVIGRELKEILESREIPCSSSHVVDDPHTSSTVVTTTVLKGSSEFPSFLGLSPRVNSSEGPVQPAVLSGEWVRPRCYVCCACGDQTSDARALTAHMSSHHPNAQVQHYEIVGESLLNADILKHLYVPPSQMSNRTRPIRGFRDCTKCKKSVTIEDLHQHMLDCAGDTPAVRRKCRSRPFGVRRRRPRLPDNVIRNKMRKDLRTRHNAKALLRTRPRIRTEVGDAETIRKMIADLPAKRHRQAAGNLNNTLILRPRRKLDKQRNKLKIKRLTSKDSKTRQLETKNVLDDSSVIDEDDQPLKPKTKVDSKLKTTKTRVSSRVLASKYKKVASTKDVPSLNEKQEVASEIANNIEPQQISCDNSTETLNINSRDGTSGEENRDTTDKNDNGGERKKSPERERDKNDDKNIDSDPALLKHSINSITSSSNDKSQLQQKRSSDKSDEDECLQDARKTFLENNIGQPLLDKPPIQQSLKRSSQKKRESLLNCIEKIKSQQKGETMSDQRQAERSIRPPFEIAQTPLLDPHPAVISRSCDETGAATNVIPLRRTDLHSDVAGQLPRINESMSTLWNSGLEIINQTNTPVLAPAAQSYSGLSNNPNIQSAHLVPTEQFNKLAQLICQQQQRSNPNPHASLFRHETEEQVDHRMSFAELLLQQKRAAEACNVELNRGNALVPVQYTSDLHYEGNKYQFPMRNEATSLSIVRHQNPNIPHSPQWNRDALQMQQHINNNNLSVPRMLSSLMTKEFLNHASAQRSPIKRTSESSESDVNSNRNMDDADFLNFAHLRRRLSSETAIMPYVSHLQGSKDITPYFRSQINHEVPINKDAKNQDNKNKNRNAYGDSTSHSTADYYRQHSQATVNDQYYTSRLTEEQILSKLRSEKDHGFTYTDKHEDSLASNSFYLNNSEKIIAHVQKRYMDGNPHNLMSTTIENRILEQTSPLKDTTARPIDMKVRDNAENYAIERKMYDHQKHKLYTDAGEHVNAREIQEDSDSMEEPLDLSGKHGSACCNDSRNIDEEREEMTYATLDLSKSSRTNTQDTHHMAVDIYTKPSTSSEHRNIRSDKYVAPQLPVPFRDQIPAIEKPIITSDGMLPYYRKNDDIQSVSYLTKNHDHNSVTNTKLLGSYSKQFASSEQELRNVNYNNETAYMTSINNIEKNQLGTQVPIISTSTISNSGVTLNEQLDKNNEKFTPTLENPRMFLQSAGIHDINMPSCSKSQQLVMEHEQLDKNNKQFTLKKPRMLGQPEGIHDINMPSCSKSQQLVTGCEQLDTNNEKLTPTVKNPKMFVQSEGIHDIDMPSCSQSQQLVTECEQLDKNNEKLTPTVKNSRMFVESEGMHDINMPSCSQSQQLITKREQFDKNIEKLTPTVDNSRMFVQSEGLNDIDMPSCSQSQQLITECEQLDKNIEKLTPTVENSRMLVESEGMHDINMPSCSQSQHIITERQQLDKNNVKLTPTAENPRMIVQSEGMHDNNMPSCSQTQQLITKLEQTESLITVVNMKVNTSPNATQPVDETTCDNKSADAKSEPTASTSAAAPAAAPAAENDNENETAKKVALFPPELVDLLNVVPKEQHNKFVSVISQLIPPNNEGPKPPGDGADPQAEPQQAEVVNVADANAPVEGSSVKIENRLSVNTAPLPSSSILPKKRHSPSARLTSHENSNASLQPPHISPTVKPLPSNDTKNINTNEALANIDKIIDLTDDDHDDEPEMSSTPIPIPKNVILESVTQATPRSSNEPSRLRSVRIKPLMSKPSTSDDKQLTITNSQQPIGIDIKSSAQTSYTVSNQAETNNINPDLIKVLKEPIFNHDQMKQSLLNQNVINESDAMIAPIIGNIQQHQTIAALDIKINEIDDSKDLKKEDHSDDIANETAQNNSTNEENPALVTESLTSITSDQIPNTIDQIFTHSQDEKLLQYNVTGVSLEPDVKKHDDIIEEESDDDVSLAVIVKQKNQGNTFSEDEDTTSDSESSNFLIQLQNEKLKVKTNETSKRLHSKDSQQKFDAIDSQLKESENNEKINYHIKNDNSYSNTNVTAPLFKESQNACETETFKSDELCSAQSNFNEIDVNAPKKSHQESIDMKINSFLNNDYTASININKDTAIIQQPLQQEYPVSSPKITEILETDSMMDCNKSNAAESTERALRRSRREKSLLLNPQNLLISKKKSTTKSKQAAVFSKLLDENTPVKYGLSKSELKTSSKMKVEKHRKSPAQTKSKKRSSHSVCGFTDINEFDNEKVEKPTGTLMTNTHSSEAGCLEYNDANKSNSHPEKRKSGSFDAPNKNKPKKSKSKDNGSMLDLNINVSSNDTLKTAESTQVKLNEYDNFDCQIATSAYKNIKKQTEKTGTEMRTACYNRPIPSQQISLTSVFHKTPVNYDPYDIDLDIDMVDMGRPILKRKKTKSVSGKKSKKSVDYENSSDNIQQKIETEMPKIAIPDSSPPCVSDSDSSISDVPLQKYVEEKAKMKIESYQTPCNNSENNNGPNYTLSEENTKTIKIPCQSVRQSSVDMKCNDTFGDSELKHDDVASVSNTTSDAVSYGDTNRNENNDNHFDDIDYRHGVDVIEPSTKQSSTQKRNRRPTVSKKSSDDVNDFNQPKLSDVGMNNLDLFTYKTPRKSNLMASKKISETFNKLESEEAYYRPSPKHRQKKSSQSDKRSATKEHTPKTRDILEDINSASSPFEPAALPKSDVRSVIEEPRPKKTSHSEKRSSTKEHSSKTRDTIFNTFEVSSPVQSTQVAKNISTFDEACASNDGEVDLITAQKMLESEEIRKLERDLYFGFKKAAEANAGKTSGFNQLRVEETSQSQSYEPYVSSPIEDYVGVDPIISPERIESPVRSESPDRSESPESLKDKPLMYPEEEVNIYEDKYDIIKRRREANANAKQFQKVNKPTQCKTGRVKKKTEKKNTKKTYTKKIQQASQVPTKAALKNFESIKISIPTQDLHMPPNVSPPHRQKRSKSLKNKQSSTKTRNDSVSSLKSDCDANTKAEVCTDIYEFQDDERPVLKGYKETRVADDYKCLSSDNEDVGVKQLSKGKKNKVRNNVAIKGKKKDQPEKTIKKKGRGKRKGKAQNRRKKTDKNGKPKGTIQVRFVPDNNEVSSYESDALPPSPADTVVEDVLKCTCSTEKYSGDHEKDTGDLEKEKSNTGNHEKNTEGRKTFKGCNSVHCRYKNDNMKNTALENIFRSSCKSEDKENKLNKLFDSLLGINKTTAKIESPDPNIKSTSLLKTDIKVSVDAPELKSKSVNEKSLDDGFSSPDHRDFENENLNLENDNSQVSSTEINLISRGEDENSSVQPSYQAEYSNDQIEMEEEELDTSNNLYNNNHDSPDKCLSSSAYVGEKLKSDKTRLKHKRGESEDRSKPTKRPSSLLDDESLSENESSPATTTTKNRGKKTALKPKNNKATRKSDVPDKKTKTSKAKNNQTTRKTEQEDDVKVEEKALNEKLSPSRKSDEGISTSHDNSADAYDIALDTGVALQRARRKCTVGKQNVLVEHWSSSESEEEPSRNKSKKSTAAKKCSRPVRKLSANRRSREETVEEESRALVHQSNELAIPEPDPEPELVSDESDAERDLKDKSEQELHGWIVGRSHKKLVTMLVCSKRKSSPDDYDDDDEKLKAIEDAKEEEMDEEKEEKVNVEKDEYENGRENNGDVKMDEDEDEEEEEDEDDENMEVDDEED